MHLDQAFVHQWCGQPGSSEVQLFTVAHAAIATRGYLTPVELEEIAMWKAGQRVLHALERDEDTIMDVTRVALAADTPGWLRHHVLRILGGVQHRVASAILTVWDPLTHTVLDFRVVEALEELKRRRAVQYGPSLGSRDHMPGYWTYLMVYRPVAGSVGVGHRALDRAVELAQGGHALNGYAVAKTTRKPQLLIN